jgi:hypothetical protein
MEPYELTTCSFIVKFWVEELATANDRLRWRGHITHIPSGERRYFEELDDILSFILPYLRAIGINPEDPPPSSN